MYIVIELQTNEAGQVANLVYAYDNYNDAESKFHTVLASAAISSIPCHACCILDQYGQIQRTEYFVHRQPEPEPESEEPEE